MITGQAHGYIEPCGCSERMIGGYSRRADFVRMLREDRKWPVIAVDVGGLLNMERVFQVQARWKLEALVKGLARMKYDALAVGTEELKFGPQKLFEVFQEFKNVDPDFALPFLGANLTIIDKSLGMPLDYTIVERGGKKVAIVSIFGDAWKNEVESFSDDEAQGGGCRRDAEAGSGRGSAEGEAGPVCPALARLARQLQEVGRQVPDVPAGGQRRGL